MGPTKKPRATLSGHDVRRIAAEAVVALSTVYRWARGEKVTGTTDVRITRAANKLGIEATP